MPISRLSRSAQRYWLPTAMAFFVNGAGFGGWAAQIPHVISRLRVDDATFGLMLLGMGVGAVIAMLFCGRLIAQFGAGALIRLGFGVFLASYVALSITGDLALFVAALFLFGASGGLMDVAMNAYASDVERHQDWRVMASLHGMWSVGGLIGAAAVSAMLAIMSDHAQAIALAASLLALFLTCQHNLTPLQHQAEGTAGRGLAIGRMTLFLGLLAAIFFSAESAVRDWSSLFLTRETEAAMERAGWGYATMSAAMALCRFCGDWMRIHFGERKMVVASGIVAVSGFLLAVASSQPMPAIIGFGLVGLGLSNTVPILISAAGRTGTPGPSIAFVVSLGYAGLLASPPLLGLLASQTSLATMFLVVAASCLAASLAWTMLSREKR